MPRGAYAEVIEGPPRRVSQAGGKLAIEPRLTRASARRRRSGRRLGRIAAARLHAGAALSRLRRGRSAAAGRLRSFRRLERRNRRRGPTRLRSRRRRSANPKDRDAREAAPARAHSVARRGRPRKKSPRRNIARLAEIPPEAAPLIDLLVEERLLSSDTRAERRAGAIDAGGDDRADA